MDEIPPKLRALLQTCPQWDGSGIITLTPRWAPLKEVVTTAPTETGTAGGHRRLSLASLREYFEGLCPEEQGESQDGESGIVCYVRVSSEKQNAAGSLARQRERLLSEVASREGLKADAIAVYSDVASSFGTRDGLNKLVDDIIGGKIRKVYCEYLDRLSRVPGLTHLINHLCKRYSPLSAHLASIFSEFAEECFFQVAMVHWSGWLARPSML